MTYITLRTDVIPLWWGGNPKSSKRLRRLHQLADPHNKADMAQALKGE